MYPNSIKTPKTHSHTHTRARAHRIPVFQGPDARIEKENPSHHRKWENYRVKNKPTNATRLVVVVVIAIGGTYSLSTYICVFLCVGMCLCVCRLVAVEGVSCGGLFTRAMQHRKPSEDITYYILFLGWPIDVVAHAAASILLRSLNTRLWSRTYTRVICIQLMASDWILV